MRPVLLKTALLLAVVLATPCSFALDEAPDAVQSAVTGDSIMSALKLDGKTAAGIRSNVAAEVETKILSLCDFPRMTQIAMARTWRLASAEQQALLIAEFKTLLVRTYPAALSSFRDRVIEFKRMRMSAGDSEVRLRSEVKQPGKDSMTIDYDMEMTPAGWKVYDIKMRGVSLIAMYRETFADAVRGEGIDGLIKSLSERNRQADSGVKPAKTDFLDQSRIMFAMLQSALHGRR